jgi:biopolymer transport protein ExbD
MKIVLVALFLLFPLSLHAEESTDVDLIINTKRFFILIDGKSYSDAAGVKVALPKKPNPVVLICADSDALHPQVVEVMEELKKMGVSKLRFRAKSDCH